MLLPLVDMPLFTTGTARTGRVRRAGSMKSAVFVRLPINLSRHERITENPLLQSCCCGPGGQEIPVDCCTAGAQLQRRANAGSATLSAYVDS